MKLLRALTLVYGLVVLGTLVYTAWVLLTSDDPGLVAILPILATLPSSVPVLNLLPDEAGSWALLALAGCGMFQTWLLWKLANLAGKRRSPRP